MSTISLPNEKQIRHFYVGNAVASETTISTFIASASVGEIQIFQHDGTAGTTEDFFIAKKNTKGSVSTSDKITPGDCTYIGGGSPVAKAGKSQKFALTGAPTAGDQYHISLKVNYGNSEENFIVFTASALAVTGDTQDTLLARLAESLGDNLAASINTTSKETGTQVVAGVQATGTVQLSAGASGSVDTLTIDGLSLIDAAVDFDTSLDQTASNLADAINAKNTYPNYTATVATDTVTITSVQAGVVTGTVASTTTTLTSVDVDLGTASAGTSTNTSNKNKYFDISASDDAVVITEKDWILEDFRVGLRTHDQLLWNGVLTSYTDTAAANVVTTATAPVFAKGQGYQIIELERFLVGHRAETGELKDYTLGFGRPYDTVVASQYYSLDLKYFDTSRDDPKHSEKMLTIVSTSNTALNTIGNAIETRNAAMVWTDL